MKTAPLTIRVYYEDTDSGGIVYHASYLRFAERARTEWLRALGINQQTLRNETGLGFVVSKLSIDYITPALLDDHLTISTEVTELGQASLKLQQDILRGDNVLARLLVTVACINSAGQVARLPKSLYNQLQG